MSTASPEDLLCIAVALQGAGRHPAAWREPTARPGDLFDAGYWTDLVREAERGLLDLVTLEDGPAMQSTHPDEPDDRTDLVRGRLDAVLVAARVGPLTGRIGLVPSVTATHTEPFHVSKAIATLDFVTAGRAGVLVIESPRSDEAALFGRRAVGSLDDLSAELADHVEVQRRLWDSWEDGAEIRDVATGRFIDRAKLHYIDFHGRWFDVKGPSITPRPPQGQPPVFVLDAPGAEDLVVRAADVVLLDADAAGERIPALRAAAADADAAAPLHLFGDLTVFLDRTAAAATRRRARLDDLATGNTGPTFAGTPAQLADRLSDLADEGLTGFRLWPAVLPHDLLGITDGLVPELQRRKIFRTAYTEPTLRARLGLARPDSRYAA